MASSSTESVELLVTGTLTASKQHLVLKKTGTRKGGIMEASCSAVMDPHGRTFLGAKRICGSCRMNSTGPIRSLGARNDDLHAFLRLAQEQRSPSLPGCWI